MKKRILSWILVIAMLMSVAPMAMAASACELGEDCPVKHLTDVPADAWYHEYIESIVENGLMIGISKTEFAPEMGLTRGMAAVLLWRGFESPKAEKATSFTDVAKDSWYADAIASLEGLELIKGVGDGKFEPERKMTREEFATVMYRLDQQLGTYIKDLVDISSFKDVKEISDWAKEAMVWAVSQGILKGTDKGLLNPAGTITRAECATIIVRFVGRDVIVPDHVVDTKEELVAAMEEGGSIVVEEDVAFAGSEVVEIKEDTYLYLLADLDASEHNSRPFNVSNGAQFAIRAEGQTIEMGKYGLVNIPEGDAIISLKGGNYVGKTDNGSLIKPRGNGNIEIFLEDVNVKDESDNGGWLVNGAGQTGKVDVTINGGTFEGYNGISGIDKVTVKYATMTFVHNAFEITKHAEIEGCTIKVLNGGTALENGNAPSSTIAVSNNGYALVKNCTLDGANHALAIYTSGGTIEAVNNTIVNGTFAEYHPHGEYPDAKFMTKVDGEIPTDLLFPICGTPCINCNKI